MRSWTVVGRLEQRQQRSLADRAKAREEMNRQGRILQMMTAATVQRDWERRLMAGWAGGSSVLALLFAPPDSQAIRTLDARGEYFDLRTGDTWDLFFPGYYRSSQDAAFERECGASQGGRSHMADWYFGPREFNDLRRTVEECSEGRWAYSGEADLVLVNAWVPDVGPPTVDWTSTISGQLTDQTAGKISLSLGGVIEAISRDLELAIGAADYGATDVVNHPTTAGPGIGRDLIVTALAEIAAALAVGATGLS